MQSQNQNIPTNKILDKTTFINANTQIKNKVTQHLKLLKMLTEQAILTTLRSDQILAIRNAEVVILNINEMNQEKNLTLPNTLQVTIMQPQKEA